MGPGRLYVVATAIGNLEDMTARAVRILREVDLIAAEDTRHSRPLLDHYGIAKPMTSYHEHNESAKTELLIRKLESGCSVALISDAGTPCISDPGYRLVQAARQRGIPVVAVPGPSAIMAALSVGGLPTDRFAFHGFFPRKRQQAESVLRQIAGWGGTHIFFESPSRLLTTLRIMDHILPDAEVAVARELTKMFEEVITGTAGGVAGRLAASGVKGECVLLLHMGKVETVGGHLTPEQLHERVLAIMKGENLSKRDAVRRVAEELHLPRNQVYEAATKAYERD